MAEELPPGKQTFASGHDQWVQPMTGSAMFTGQTPLVLLLTPMWQTLLAQARTLSGRGEHQFAVVLAHAACELATEEALNNLIRRRADPALADVLMAFAPNACSLADDRVREVFGLLTGDYPAGNSELRIGAAPWWKAWLVSRKLRHNVAHAGAMIQQQEATACLEAVDAYLKCIAEAVAKSVPAPQL